MSAYSFTGENKKNFGLTPVRPELEHGRNKMVEAQPWLDARGASGADAAAGNQFSQAGRQGAMQRAGGPMAAQAGMRDIAAAYGGGARAGGVQGAQEFGARMGTAQGNAQNLYSSDVAEYRSMAEAYNDMQKGNRAVDAANADRERGGAQRLGSSIPIVGKYLF